MAKNIVIVSSSPRKNGNTEALVSKFEQGALDNGNVVTKIALRDIKVDYCKGCFYCQKADKCIINDDINGLLDTVQNADVICFATPVYYYSMNGQLKTFIDRLNTLFRRKNNFKEIYLLTASDDEGKVASSGVIIEIENWLKCFPNAKFIDGVYAGGVENVGDVLKNTQILNDAYALGKSIN